MLSDEAKQDILERSTAGVLTQGGASIGYDEDGDAECRYRAPDGRCCAIGHLISDEHYMPELEGGAITNVLVSEAVGKSLGHASNVDAGDEKFLDALQAAHDNAALHRSFATRRRVDDAGFLSRWRERLELVCEGFGLRFPEELFES